MSSSKIEYCIVENNTLNFGCKEFVIKKIKEGYIGFTTKDNINFRILEVKDE